MANNPDHSFIKANARGFTLIEILVALAIFSIGILAVAKMQIWNVNNNSNSNITTIATMMAREKLEWMKSQDLAAMTDSNEYGIDANGDPGGIFDRYCTVTPDGTDPINRLQVRVSWTRQGKAREVVLTTITRGNGT